ncbi:MAG: hypothetical protein ACJAVA_000275 [Flavobacteriaceae bacterium]|jgi:hypothetical protein
MALDFTVTISEQEVLEKWAEQVSVNKWIEMYTILSDSFSSWDVDLKLAEFIVKRVKEEWIDKYREEDIPEVLFPLLKNAVTNDVIEQNKKNQNITLEEVSGEVELKAIELLRDYDLIDYSDAVNLFCNGYDFAEKQIGNVDLSKVDMKDLIKEIQNRG